MASKYWSQADPWFWWSVFDTFTFAHKRASTILTFRTKCNDVLMPVWSKHLLANCTEAFFFAKIASNGKKWQARGGADTSAAAIIRPSFMHQPKPPHFLFVLKFQIQIDTRQGHPMPLCMAGGLAWYHPTPNTPKPYVPMDSWSMNEKNWNTAWKMLSFQSKN